MSQQIAPENVLTAERRQKALQLRMRGARYEDIGRALGISRQGAHKLVRKALAAAREITAETAAELRQLELERLDALTLKLWPRATEPRAVDSLVRIIERRMKLLGLEAAGRLEVTHDVAGDALQRFADRLASRVAAVAARNEAAASDHTDKPAGS